VLEFTAPQPVDLGRVRSLAGSFGLGDVSVQNYASPTDPSGLRSVSLRFQTPTDGSPAATVTRVRSTLTQALGALTFSRTDVVGPAVSSELLRNGVIALLVAIALVLGYIWFRFGFTFGVGAVTALAHDVILTFGLFAATGLEFDLNSIAAILTIIGYSINDKVVALDRVRENLRKYKKMPLGEIIDLSVNETLSRTIITGFTGILALMVLAIFGGEELFPFSVAMIFGIVVGTYSSVYVAAPLLMVLGVRRGDRDAAEPLPPSTSARVARP